MTDPGEPARPESEGGGQAVENLNRMPPTSNQRGIWAAEAQTPDDPQFNIVVHEWLTGPLAQMRCARASAE
ncbi:hypothetical protein SAZ11_17430 [Streptomyces sp. FXJ1.4098]|nr:hypothetical protein [Streptomyces sp. FXJ1.4098]